MTPIHIRATGAGINVVGLVISAHTLGMFAFSPLTEWLTTRIGPLRVTLVGQILLMIAVGLAFPAAGDDKVLLVGALFLRGLGWNFGFVAGSALLTEGLHGAAKIRAHGLGDTITGAASATAVFSSGLLLSWGSYARLNVIGGAIVVAALLYRVSPRTPRRATI